MQKCAIFIIKIARYFTELFDAHPNGRAIIFFSFYTGVA